MRRILATALAAALLAAAIATPAHAVLPTKKGGGTVVVDTSRECKVTLVGPGKSKTKRKVPSNGVARGLAPGKYKVKASPKLCETSSKTVKVRKGKKTKTSVLNDPKIVPTVLSGSFTGQELFANEVASWSGEMRWELDGVYEESGSGLLGTKTVAMYKLTELSGTWSIGGSNTDCTYSGSGSFSMPDPMRYSAPILQSDPWSNFVYTMDVVFGEIAWPYTETCTTFEGERVRNMVRRIPPQRVVTSNGWEASRPIPPLASGASPTGSLTWQETAWTWALGTDNAKKVGKP